jgi:DNA-binding PadR family transcriptional regulator/polyisoprenoid-binding protein YceI
MEGAADERSGSVSSLGRFELAPPRRFLFPALLLLLAEEPGYGYRLFKELNALRFGSVDRPSVYRTLAQLERDGLAESWSDGAVASSQSRRLYRLTSDGERALRVWMGVIKEERDRLDSVLRRYAGSGGFDGALAGVEGEWGAVHGPPISALKPTPEPAPRRPAGPRVRFGAPAEAVGPPQAAHLALVPDRCAVLVEARSTVGPLTFGVMGLTGTIDTRVCDGRVDAGGHTTATVIIPTEGLRSGNAIYDAELRRRIDARRYPQVTLTLDGCVPGSDPDRFRVSSAVTIHGVTRQLEGTIVVGQPGPGLVSVTGEQVVDIRDFDIASPTVLMLRIYPDVVVRLYLEAERVDDVGVGTPEEATTCG